MNLSLWQLGHSCKPSAEQHFQRSITKASISWQRCRANSIPKFFVERCLSLENSRMLNKSIWNHAKKMHSMRKDKPDMLKLSSQARWTMPYLSTSSTSKLSTESQFESSMTSCWLEMSCKYQSRNTRRLIRLSILTTRCHSWTTSSRKSSSKRFCKVQNTHQPSKKREPDKARNTRLNVWHGIPASIPRRYVKIAYRLNIQAKSLRLSNRRNRRSLLVQQKEELSRCRNQRTAQEWRN